MDLDERSENVLLARGPSVRAGELIRDNALLHRTSGSNHRRKVFSPISRKDYGKIQQTNWQDTGKTYIGESLHDLESVPIDSVHV
jgi:hypothetical protein